MFNKNGCIYYIEEKNIKIQHNDDSFSSRNYSVIIVWIIIELWVVIKMKKIMKFIFKITDISIIILVLRFYPVYMVIIFQSNRLFEKIFVDNVTVNNLINCLYSKSLLRNVDFVFTVFMYVVILSVLYFIKFAAEAAKEPEKMPKTLKKMFLVWGVFFPHCLFT